MKRSSTKKLPSPLAAEADAQTALRQVHYTHDAVSRLREVTTTIAGSPQALVSAVAWRADGRLTGRTFGNGLRETRSYDARGQFLTQLLGAETAAYRYDPPATCAAAVCPAPTTPGTTTPSTG